MNYETRYPSVADLKVLAKKRLPKFVFEYIDGGIDEEFGKRRNRGAFQEIKLTPRYLRDVSEADLAVELFGRRYRMPFGVPPVGLGNMIWPGAESALASACQQAGIPYVLSTMSTTALEDIARLAPDVCWFQLYVPRDVGIMKDLLERVRTAGIRVLMVTLDIPVGAKRNRELKIGLKLPFSMTPSIVWQCMRHPAWALASLQAGVPDFVNVMRYNPGDNSQGLASFITQFIMSGVTRERIRMIRELWDGPMILKGIQHPEDALDAVSLGVDGVVLSNHGGRQLDAAPSSLQSLRELPDAVKQDLTVMIDSGIRCGLDVLRGKALGAQCAFSGLSFFYGMGAMGGAGATQVIEIYRDEITRSLQQLGCPSFQAMDSTWLSEA